MASVQPTFLIAGDENLESNIRLLAGGCVDTLTMAIQKDIYYKKHYNAKYGVTTVLLVVVIAAAVLLSKQISPTVGGLTGIGTLIPVAALVYIKWRKNNHLHLIEQLGLSETPDIFQSIKNFFSHQITTRQNTLKLIMNAKLQNGSISDQEMQKILQEEQERNKNRIDQASRISNLTWDWGYMPGSFESLKKVCTVFAASPLCSYRIVGGIIQSFQTLEMNEMMPLKKN